LPSFLLSLPYQVGVTDKQQYIHRVGRTARAGKSGVGVLVLCEFEAGFQVGLIACSVLLIINCLFRWYQPLTLYSLLPSS
jgi:hypothetical protein